MVYIEAKLIYNGLETLVICTFVGLCQMINNLAIDTALRQLTGMYVAYYTVFVIMIIKGGYF